MAFKAGVICFFLVFWVVAGVLCFWLPARMERPGAEPLGPEVVRRRWGPGRRAGAVIFAVLSLVLLGAAGLAAAIEVSPAQPPDFDSDTWAAECQSSFARNTVSRKKRHTLTQSCGSFTGATTLWRIYNREGGEEVTVEYRIAVEEGRADLVLVGPDGAVTRLSGENSPYTFTAGAGETRLRLIGDQGKLEFTVTIPSLAGTWMDR